MTLGEFFLENFAGDLEYHPRRAGVYLILGIAAVCFWIFSPPNTKFTAIPLVAALGSLTLFLKGVFLLRKSSEGIGLSEQEVTKLSDNRKSLPSIPHQAAQIVQDFGGLGTFAGAEKTGNSDGGEKGDNGDHDHDFDEGKSATRRGNRFLHKFLVIIALAIPCIEGRYMQDSALHRLRF